MDKMNKLSSTARYNDAFLILKKSVLTEIAISSPNRNHVTSAFYSLPLPVDPPPSRPPIDPICSGFLSPVTC